MLCRLLLAVFIVTCMCFRDAYTDTTTQLKLKDLICVLVLSGIQKEDLDVTTLEKLQRQNVNTDHIFNNEQVKQECIHHHLQNAVNLSQVMYLNSTTPKPWTKTNHSLATATEAITEYLKPQGNVVFLKLFVFNNGSDFLEQKTINNATQRRGYQIQFNENPEEFILDHNSVFRYDVNDRDEGIVHEVIRNSTTTQMTEKMISGSPKETTNEMLEEIKTATATVHTTTVNDKPVEHIKQPNISTLHTKIDVNETEHEDNSQFIGNLDSYIKEQIQKYLSKADKTKANNDQSSVSQDRSNLICSDSYFCNTVINDRIQNKLQLMQDLTAKAATEVANLSKGQLILNMNLLNKLADNIKEVILKDIREELLSTPKDSAPLPSTISSVVSSALSVTVSPKEIDKERLPLKGHVDAITKLMEFLDNMRPQKPETTLIPTAPPSALYPFKTVYTLYQNQQQPYGLKPTYNEVKQMYKIPKTPYPIPPLVYVDAYEHFKKTQEQTPINHIPMLQNKLPTLPIINPRVVKETKTPIDTVKLQCYDTNHLYETAKHSHGTPTEGSDAPNQQEYNGGELKVYELPNTYYNPPVQFEHMYITSKPESEPYETPKPQEYAHPPKPHLYVHMNPKKVPPTAQPYKVPAHTFRSKQSDYYGNPKVYEYPNIHQNTQYQNLDQKITDPILVPKNYWLPPVVSYNKLNTTIKHTPVTKIQTNIAEIPPLRFISGGHPVFQNIVVPNSPVHMQPKLRPRNTLSKPNAVLPKDSSLEHWNRIRHQMQTNIEDMELHHENPLSPRLDDIWHYNKNHYGNAAKYHVQLEHNNQDDMPAPGPHHHHDEKEAENSEHTRVASRQQMPYAQNHIFDDKHIKQLMKSQQRISDILERVLSLNKMIDHTSSQLLN